MTTVLTRDIFSAGLIAQGTVTVPAPVNGTDPATKDYVDTKAVPTGSAIFFGGTVAPTGWLLCNGQLVSRTTYAGLFSVIGTMYGAGDGSTTFAIPSMKAMVGLGAGFVVSSYIMKT